MGLRKDGTYLQFKDAIPDTVLGWDGASHSFHMGAFTPSTGSTNGTVGLVPKPLAGQQNFILSASGWILNSGGGGGGWPLSGDATLTGDVFINGDNKYLNLGGWGGTEAFEEIYINTKGGVWMDAEAPGLSSNSGFMRAKLASDTDFAANIGISPSKVTATVVVGAAQNASISTGLSLVGYVGGGTAPAVGRGISLEFALQGSSGSTIVTGAGISYISDVTPVATFRGHYDYTLHAGSSTAVRVIQLDRYGFRYEADYSANWTNRSLVDRGYVLQQIALGGAAIINTAGVNELPKSGSAVTIVPSGVFSLSTGTLSLGTGLAGTSRYIAAEGSASDVGLKLYTKGAGIMDFAFGNGGAVIGDAAISGGRTLTVGSSGSSADLFIYSKGAGSAITLANTSATASSFRFDGSTATLSLQKSPTAGATTFDIVGSNGINATFTHGDSLRIKAGDGYDTSGNGQGGNVIVQAGIKRAGGSGVDGAITLAFRDGILNIGDPNVAGNRLVQIGSADANPSLTIRQQGTGTLNLGLVTGLINLVGSGIRMNSTAGSAGQFLRYDMTWATPSTGPGFTNTATAGEVTKSTSSTAVEGTGVFSYAHGDLSLGTDIAANRNIYADGSSATVDIRLFPKGTSGKIILGVDVGAVVLGSTLVVGSRTLTVGSADTNADFNIQTAGTGYINIGYTTNRINLVGTILRLNGTAGSAGQYLRYDMTWATPPGGLSNTAAANELMKSVSGNAAPSGIFSTSLGSLNLGTGLTGATRYIFPEGSATDVGISISPKGAGTIELGVGAISVPLIIGSTVSNGSRKISIGSSDTNANLTIEAKGTGQLILGTALIDLGTTSIAGDRSLYAKSSSTHSSIYLMPQVSGHIVLGTVGGAVYIGDTTSTGSRYINTGSSSALADLTIKGKGAAAIIMLAVESTGRVRIGDDTTAGSRNLEVGSNETNTDFNIYAKGTGKLNLGVSTGPINLIGNQFQLNGVAGTSGQYFGYDGWRSLATAYSNFDSGLAPTGLTSITTQYCRYRDDGVTVSVIIGIEGTSTSNALTFTLPAALASFYSTAGLRYICMVIDGGINKTGRIVGSGSSANITANCDVSGVTTWTTSGAKALFIQFSYAK
jgi:hypothetical protein